MIDKINSWPPSNSASSQRRTRTRPMSLQYLITRSAVVCIRVRVSCKIVLLVLCSTYGMGTRLVYKSVVFKRLFSNSGHTIENHKQQDRICYSKKKNDNAGDTEFENHWYQWFIPLSRIESRNLSNDGVRSDTEYDTATCMVSRLPGVRIQYTRL